MMWKTHIWGGMQAGIILATATHADPKTAAIEIGAATLGSILPDIDQPNSKISRSDIVLRATANQLSKVTKHRRGVHSVWASFLFGVIAGLFLMLASSASVTGFSFFIGLIVALLIDFSGMKIGIPMGMVLFFLIPLFIKTSWFTLDSNLIIPTATAVFLGCISHLIYDTVNVQGIMWLHPFKKKRYRISTIQTDSKEESFFRVLMVLTTLVLFVVLQPFGTQQIFEIFNNTGDSFL